MTQSLPSPRQAEVLSFIESAMALGQAPSYREIAEAIGVTSMATINKHVHALERKGFLSIRRYKQRGLLMTGRGASEIRVAGECVSCRGLDGRELVPRNSLVVPREAAVRRRVE